jgi:hypothetical protein
MNAEKCRLNLGDGHSPVLCPMCADHQPAVSSDTSFQPDSKMVIESKWALESLVDIYKQQGIDSLFWMSQAVPEEKVRYALMTAVLELGRLKERSEEEDTS